MGVKLINIKDYFSKNPEDDLYIENHRIFIDDLERWASLCSAAFERATYISGCIDSNVYYISNSFLKITGYNRDDTQNNKKHFLHSIIHPYDLNFIDKVYKELSNYLLNCDTKYDYTKYNAKYYLRIKKKTEGWTTLECYSYPIYVVNNKVHFCITHAKVSTETFIPSFQFYFIKENKRFIYDEKKGIFLPDEKIKLKDVEIQVLLNTAHGMKEYEISRKMDIELNTIKYYKKSILKKLSVNSMPEAIYFALKKNII
ncbi:MAG: LuxR C-terminal-related transcriptional regulator [Bacteroidales bacterium]